MDLLGPSRQASVVNGQARDVSRRSFLKLVIAAGGGAALASAAPRQAHAEEAVSYPKNFTFAVMSDIHYFSPDLYGDNPDYTVAENSDRKMFRESSDILDKALEDIVAAKPNMVIVPGDLTKDGEFTCHEQVAEKFANARERLEAADVDTQFYVINGNHDLNNHHGKDFSGGAALDAKRTDPLTFKNELWVTCGYTDTTTYDPDGTADGSLSYVAQPCPGLTLIVVDTCKYNVDAGDGTMAQETSGHISSDLLTWVCDQAKQARAAGDVVVAMQHHGIVPHFGYEPVIFGEYLVDDYEAVAQAYADAGISAVFTGHMHANDIAAATYGDATIYDIETGSLVTYPSRMRMGSFAFAQDGNELTCTITVDSHDLGQVTLDECGLTAGAQDITAYGKERTLTVDSIQTMLGGMIVEPLLAQYAPQGVKALLAGLLAGAGVGDGSAGSFNASLWTFLTGFMQQSGMTSARAGLVITIPSSAFGSLGSIVGMVGNQLPGYSDEGITVSLYYDAARAQLNVDGYDAPEEAALTLSLTEEQATGMVRILEDQGIVDAQAEGSGSTYLIINEQTLAAFVDALAAELDTKALGNTDALAAVVDQLVGHLLGYEIDASAHTLLGLVDYAYQDHLMGCETLDDWAQAGAENAPAILGGAVDSAIEDTLSDSGEGAALANLARSINLDLSKLVVAGDVEVSVLFKQINVGELLIGVLPGMIGTLADVLGFLTSDDGTPSGLGALVAGLLPNLELMGEPVSTLAQNALTTLMVDDNVDGSDPTKTDHDFSLAAGATIPGGGDDSDVVDKDGLQTVIDQAGRVEMAGASQAAVDELKAALALAQRVMSNPDASEADVAAARERLEQAIAAVEASKDGDDTNPSGGPGAEAEDAAEVTKPEGDRMPQTDDPSMVAPVAATVLGGGLIAAGLGVRRHMNATGLDE